MIRTFYYILGLSLVVTISGLVGATWMNTRPVGDTQAIEVVLSARTALDVCGRELSDDKYCQLIVVAEQWPKENK